MTQPGAAQHGFTLGELVIVLLVVSVLAVFALPRLSTSEFAGRGTRDRVATALRYAQKSAIAMRRNVCVEVGATQLAVTYASLAGSGQACAAANTLADPATGQPFASSGYVQGETVTNPTTVVFDALGRPQAAASITVTHHASAITVEAETGTVH